jgi:hypothetical protein
LREGDCSLEGGQHLVACRVVLLDHREERRRSPLQHEIVRSCAGSDCCAGRPRQRPLLAPAARAHSLGLGASGPAPARQRNAQACVEKIHGFDRRAALVSTKLRGERQRRCVLGMVLE